MSQPTYAFGAFRLQPDEQRLLRDGEPVPLPPRVFDTLVALVERRGRLVDKEELLHAVWNGAFVEEANLTVNISTLRRVLGELPEGQPLIETVRGRGYRFLAPVTLLENGGEATLAPVSAAPSPAVATDEAADSRPKLHWNRPLLFAMLLLGIAAAAVLVGGRLERPVPDLPRIRTLAILPFRSVGVREETELFGLGMADALITRLSNVRSVAVRPTSAVVRYARDEPEAASAGRELGTDAVLLGLVQRTGQRVRTTLQLVRTADSAVLWADTFDETASDVFALQDAVSARMATALTLELSPAERRSLAKRYTSNPEAYELYLRGRYHWFQWTPEGWGKAREYFSRAVEVDPEYALAYAGLAEVHGVLSFVTPPVKTAARSKEMALKALALDPTLAEAHLALGPRLFFYDWDWAGAEAEYRRALELNPNNALAHDVHGIYLYAMGRTEEAVAEARRALSLDPLSAYMGWDYGEALYYTRRFEESAAALQRTLAREPAFYAARFSLVWVREQQGRKDEAVQEYLRALRLAGTDDREQADLRAAYEHGGVEGFWFHRLSQLAAAARRGYIPAYEPASIAAQLGHAETAFRWLERAYRDRAPEMVRLAVDPRLDPLRRDPRFGELLRRMRLPG
ncbi:MAG TPA: winged helix-turn-helix domain-containing protein [Thermoanaerobaculia bacterium]|jgi:DNA-binding winged helix-turn-helix (wHTH) protein/TolB-like protein/Flp pilus assembly protein TadD|nr:winged helix-turn-helix domain-containing protein [Thermoanaerobaculia bacterium]